MCRRVPVLEDHRVATIQRSTVTLITSSPPVANPGGGARGPGPPPPRNA